MARRARYTQRTLLQTDTQCKQKFQQFFSRKWNSDAEQIISSGANLFIEVEQYLCLFSFLRRNSFFFATDFFVCLLLCDERRLAKGKHARRKKINVEMWMDESLGGWKIFIWIKLITENWTEEWVLMNHS